MLRKSDELENANRHDYKSKCPFFLAAITVEFDVCRNLDKEQSVF